MSALTPDAFAAMLGHIHVPLCEANHNCGRVATHYLQAHHECIAPMGYVYPACAEATRPSLTAMPGWCPVCQKVIPRLEFVTVAGQVEVAQ